MNESRGDPEPGRFFSRIHWQSRLVLWFAASVVGCVAVVFARCADEAQAAFFALSSTRLSWLLPPAGFAGITWITRRWFQGAESSGIPQTIHALRGDASDSAGGWLRPRIIAGRIFLTVMSLLCGASVGREGPTVHVGAGIMRAASRWMPSGAAGVKSRTLILAGGAAGIAAAFNTPLAGVVFAIEELARSFEERTSGAAVTAVVLAGVTAIALAGNYSYFGTPALDRDHGVSLTVFAVAVVGGVLGGLFSRTLLWVTRGIPGALGELQRRRPIVFAATCGALVSILGQLSGAHSFGTGYAEARAAVEDNVVLGWAYAPARALATLLALISGIPGGLFAPSLSVGAGLGQWLGLLLENETRAQWPVLGMCAYLAGVTQAPLTAFVIVLEMTAGHSMALPLMLTAASAAALSRAVSPSLYRTLASRYAHNP